MSGWTGLVVLGIAIGVAFATVGQPLWAVKFSDPPQTTTWTYGLFNATFGSSNTTTGNSSSATYSYPGLPGQPNLAAVFLAAQQMFLLALVAGFAAAGLSVVTALGRLRGLYAGIASAVASAASLYTSLSLVLGVPQAAGDLPTFGGDPISQFEGTSVARCGTSVCAVLSYGPGLAWYLLLGLGILLAFGATEVWHIRPAKKGSVTKVSDSARTPPPPPPPEKVEPVIEEVFVIGANGLLIKHMSRSLMQDIDRDVVGGMISVVSSFVREAFPERDGTVKEVSLGDHRFVMASERGLVVAALVKRGNTEDVLHRLRHLLAVLIDRYGKQLDDWEGESLIGIEDEISVLWEPFFAPPPPID